MKDLNRNVYLGKELMGHINIKTTLGYIETDINLIKRILLLVTA